MLFILASKIPMISRQSMNKYYGWVINKVLDSIAHLSWPIFLCQCLVVYEDKLHYKIVINL